MKTLKIFALGGGGGGGNNAGGGGGAGGYVYDSAYAVTSQTYAVVVGAKGVGVATTSASGTDGTASTFGTITANGGGGGAGNSKTGNNGGCGGGGGQGDGKAGGTGSQGGNGGSTVTPWGGGGGAGGGGCGGNAPTGGISARGGAGGAPISNSITGSAVNYGGGGGGAGGDAGYGAGGGAGAGRGGASNVENGYSATAYGSGGGGGGGGGNFKGGDGYAGVVILSWVTADFGTCSVTGTGNAITTNGANSIATFIVSGNFICDIGSTVPTVTTQAVSEITNTTATGNGNVTADGGATITERGVCIGYSVNPTTADTKFTTTGTTGAFTVSMTSLTKNTHYHARAYAINSEGTSYGADVEFTTTNIPDEMRDFTNKPGATYDANKTTVIFAEDMALIKEWIEYLNNK